MDVTQENDTFPMDNACLKPGNVYMCCDIECQRARYDYNQIFRFLIHRKREKNKNSQVDKQIKNEYINKQINEFMNK